MLHCLNGLKNNGFSVFQLWSLGLSPAQPWPNLSLHSGLGLQFLKVLAPKCPAQPWALSPSPACTTLDVDNATKCCFEAIGSLHDLFVCPLTHEEKEVEKWQMDDHLGFQGLWREGCVVYDGTIVVLYQGPGMSGDSYYTWKMNYGLNCQVCLLKL